MSDLNHVTLSGNLTRDPELRATSGGTNVASLRIGSKGFGDKSNFFDITVWQNPKIDFDLASVVTQAFSKGDKIQLTGRLEYREWEQDGNKRSAVQVVADNIVLPPKGQNAPAPAAPTPDPEF